MIASDSPIHLFLPYQGLWLECRRICSTAPSIGGHAHKRHFPDCQGLTLPHWSSSSIIRTPLISSRWSPDPALGSTTSQPSSFLRLIFADGQYRCFDGSHRRNHDGGVHVANFQSVPVVGRTNVRTTQFGDALCANSGSPFRRRRRCHVLLGAPSWLPAGDSCRPTRGRPDPVSGDPSVWCSLRVMDRSSGHRRAWHRPGRLPIHLFSSAFGLVQYGGTFGVRRFDLGSITGIWYSTLIASGCARFARDVRSSSREFGCFGSRDAGVAQRSCLSAIRPAWQDRDTSILLR